MGDLSEHFGKRDFTCRCGECKDAFKISLTLVGVLEMMRTHFNKRVNILKGYTCPDYAEKQGGVRKSYHARGQAADITVDGVPLEEVFSYAETIAQAHGIGFYPFKKFVHVDVREEAKSEKWVYEDDYLELTDARRQKYSLPVQAPIPEAPAIPTAQT
ncbi:MAG: D-Ala-D-Ala carboxypeptidase family metallohydrolase [Candidatus Margulisiibacteriota bacterium]|jgi:uncharacterized protein YcbK (DUF882 family)